MARWPGSCWPGSCWPGRVAGSQNHVAAHGLGDLCAQSVSKVALASISVRMNLPGSVGGSDLARETGPHVSTTEVRRRDPGTGRSDVPRALGRRAVLRSAADAQDPNACTSFALHFCAKAAWAADGVLPAESQTRGMRGRCRGTGSANATPLTSPTIASVPFLDRFLSTAALGQAGGL